MNSYTISPSIWSPPPTPTSSQTGFRSSRHHSSHLSFTVCWSEALSFLPPPLGVLMLCLPWEGVGFSFRNLHLQARGLFCKSHTVVQSGSKLHNLSSESLRSPFLFQIPRVRNFFVFRCFWWSFAIVSSGCSVCCYWFLHHWFIEAPVLLYGYDVTTILKRLLLDTNAHMASHTDHQKFYARPLPKCLGKM